MTQTSITQYLSDVLTIDEINRFPDLPTALEYLLLKDSTPKLNMDQITDMLSNKYPSFPTSRQGAYMRLEKWRNDGTLRLAEQMYLTPKVEEMRSALGRAITALPDLIDRLITEAKSGKSGKNALDITVFLMDLVQGEMSKVEEPGDIEHKYARTPKSRNPMDIVPEN